jgi:hypothetical protein
LISIFAKKFSRGGGPFSKVTARKLIDYASIFGTKNVNFLVKRFPYNETVYFSVGLIAIFANF